MALHVHGPGWFRRVPLAWWMTDEFHSSVRLSALTDDLQIAVFLQDGGGGARSVLFADLLPVANQTMPRLDGDEFILHFRRTPAGWECNGIAVDVREW